MDVGEGGHSIAKPKLVTSIAYPETSSETGGYIEGVRQVALNLLIREDRKML